MRRKAVAVVILMGLLAAGRPTWAKEQSSEGSYGRDAGYGTLAAITNFVYVPFKLVYAGLGGLTGCLAYVLTVGNSDVAESVWSPSLGGSYVVTPAMLRGEEEFLFSGTSHERK